MDLAWILSGLLIVGGGVLPNAKLMRTTQKRGIITSTCCCVDMMFVLAALAFLYLGVAYQSALYPKTPKHVPFRSSRRSSRSQYPAGFIPAYLRVAMLISVVAPATLLACLWLHHAPSLAPVAHVLLPYFVVFIPQILAETQTRLGLNRSCMAPVVPLLFFPYRLWQLLRGMALTDDAVAHTTLHILLCFWVFDTSALLTWLPSMCNAQLIPPP